MLNRPNHKRFAAALAGAALLATAACGGGGSRPSTSSIEKAISKNAGGFLGEDASSLPKGAVHCLAQALHDSKISDKALKALVDNDKDFKASKADESAAKSVEAKATKCLGSGSD